MSFRSLVLTVCFALVPSIGYCQNGQVLRIIGAVANSLGQQQQQGFQPQQQGFQPQQQGFQQQGFQQQFQPQQQWQRPQQFQQQRHTTFKPGNYQRNIDGSYSNSTTGSHYIPNQRVVKPNGRIYNSVGNGIYQNADGATYRPDTGQYNSGSRGYISPR